MPWAALLTVILKLADMLLGKAKKNSQLRQQMFEFINKWDQTISDDAELRKQYQELLRRSREKKK